MDGALVGILAVLGLLGAAAFAARSSDPPKPAPKPLPPPPPPPPPSKPALPWPLPPPIWPDVVPVATQTANNATTIASDGTKVFRQDVLPQLLPVLAKYGVEPVEGDPMKVKLVARNQPGQVSAAQWAEAYSKYAIAAVEWLPYTHEPKYLRAIQPDEARNIAPPNGFYAILTGPVIIAQWPQSPQTPQWPQQPPSMPAPPQPTGLEELPPEAQAKVASLLAGSNADAMETTANDLESQGYTRSAEVLRKRAADLRLAASVSNTAAGRNYTVRGNELPSQVAAWYTGDGNRWRELLQTNKDLRIRKVGTVEYLTPWKSGMVVVLPTTWNIKKGPMPIVQSAAANKTPTQSAVEAFPGLSQTSFQTPPPK